MMSIVEQRCASCGRFYGPSSKPRWAFTREGRMAGTVHASCLLARGYHYLSTSLSQTVAQFDIWTLELRPRPPRESDDWQVQFLISLAEDPLSETLSDHQVERMRWWTVNGPLQLGEHREPGLREAYAALVREFLQWRRTLQAGPNGCS